MPAGDAGLDLDYLRQTVETVGYLLPSHCKQLFTEVERLQVQVATQQAVIDAARLAVGGSIGGHVALNVAIRVLDKAQAAQPEGEQA